MASPHLAAAACAGAVLALVVACTSSSSSSDGGATSCASPGGPVAGVADAHCVVDGGKRVQVTDMAACYVDAAPGDDGGGGDASSGGSGGTGPCGTDYGATMVGQSGSDDDCKYDLSWTSTSVCENQGGVTFTVTATRRADGTPLTGGAATTYAEVTNGCQHPSPSTGNTTETSPGVYEIGPIVFDQPGQWTVRFHLYGSCFDLAPDSPHGHAAFYVQVP